MKRIFAFLLTASLVAVMSGCAAPATGTVDSASESVSTPDEPEVLSAEPLPEPEPPDVEWAFGEPEDHGVNADLLAEVNRNMARSQMYAAVVVKDGVIIDEYYRDGYDETSLFHMHSVTKSVMDALIGIAIDRGVLAGTDVRLAEFFPQLSDGKEAITVEHLLTHTAGLGEGDSASFRTITESDNWVESYLLHPLSYEPGSTFRYSTAGSHMLSVVIERASGESTEDFAVEHLFTPIGIESYEWESDPQGTVDGGNGLLLSVRDAARLGQLYLDGGNWRGNQVVPREWVELSTSVHAQGESDKGQYGYQWWIWTFAGHDVYYALGYAGQFVFVVPDLNLVTAIASQSVWSDFTGQVCIRDIIAACE